MTKNIEVELRALLPDAAAFEQQLKEQGAKFLSSVYICDIYFCPKSFNSVEDAEMHAVGSYSIRLRKTRKGDAESLTLNTKTITSEGDHHAWEEHEVTVGDYAETAKILMLTEFKPFFKLEKTRRAYAYDGMEILIEDITDFGTALEIEIMAAPGEEAASKDKIRRFLHSVGVGDDAIAPKSVTNIVMKQRAFKQDISF